MKRGQYGGIFSRLLFLLTLLLLLASLYAVRNPLLRLAGEFWMVNDPAVHADAIIVLGDDNYYGDRAAHAAELYRQGFAPVVVASGRALRPYAGIAEMMERDLEARGVPASAILKFQHRAQNTREEAQALAGLIAEHHWNRVLVVTSNYHARRAGFIFERTLPGIGVTVSSANDLEFDPAAWWQSRMGQKLFFSELVGYVVAIWELRGRSAAFVAPIPAGSRN